MNSKIIVKTYFVTNFVTSFYKNKNMYNKLFKLFVRCNYIVFSNIDVISY